MLSCILSQLGELLSVGRVALYLSLSIACSTRSKENLYLTCPPTPFLSHSLAYPPPSKFHLLHSLSFLLAVSLSETVRYSVWLYSVRSAISCVCSPLLCLAIMQPIIRSALPVDIPTDYTPLYSACRYFNLLSALLSPALLQTTIRSALSGVTPAD
jgi:hypothetical protein